MGDIEDVKQLKARYCRLLDTKDWEGFREVFADDVVTDHQCHTPEITVTSPSTATGIWAMEDRVQLDGGRELNGFGHYHEVYEKSGGSWRIKASTLTRIRMDITKPHAG
jgi:hypothetical protein